MTRHFKIVRTSREVSLVASRGGHAFLAMLVLEAVVFTIGISWLWSVAADVWDVAAPTFACIAIMAWTSSHIASDARLSFDLVKRTGRLARISPWTGRSQDLEFELDRVSGIALRPIGSGHMSTLDVSLLVVALSMIDGRQLEFRIEGAPLACRELLARFSADTGLAILAPDAVLSRRILPSGRPIAAI